MDESQRRLLGVFLNGFLLPDIKRIIGHLNDRLLMRMSRTQRKGVLIATIIDEVTSRLANNDDRILDVLVEVMNQQKMSQIFEHVDNHIDMIGAGNNMRSRPDSSMHAGSNSTYGTAPRISAPSSSFQYKVDYKTSPFYTIETSLTPPKICTSSVNARASRLFTFEMTPEQQRYFGDRDPDDGRPLYEIRFFCTGYDTQSPSRAKDIEFPAICEIKVNSDHTINGNTVRGMKNKPGTANPADLTSFCHLSARRNSIEFVYAHTPKPYIGTVELVKRLPVAEIVNRLKATSTISKQETIQRLQEREADNDIVLEYETISTKCPLGFTRIKTPSRSKKCQHLQCFDAATFLMMNQQTPTWCCPICNRKMDSWEEVGVDEYFLDILAQVSEKVDIIRIEEGGKFKVLESDDMDGDSDEDDEFMEMDSSTKSNKRSLVTRENSTGDDDHGNEKMIDSVTILDDDGDDVDPDDIPLSKRHKNTTPARPSEPPANTENDQVIDLTLDSDDDDQDTNDSSNNDIGGSDNGSNRESDESSGHTSLPNPTTSTSTSSSTLSPSSSLSTAQSGIIAARQSITTTAASASPSVSNDSASPAITKITNSSPATTSRNLIRLPWPPALGHPSPIASTSSNIVENSVETHLPPLNLAQQSAPTQSNSIQLMAPSTASPYTNSTLPGLATSSSPPSS